MAQERWRLFVAAPLPGPAADELWQALSGVRERHPSVRWTLPEQYHATLVFLGSTPPTEAARLAAALEVVAGGWRSFVAAVAGSGGRDGGWRGGVAWLKVGSGRQELGRLSLEIDRALRSGVYEASPPRPHVTVARRVDAAVLGDLAESANGLQIRWLVERIVLFRSHLGPRGSRFEELATARLAS